MSRSPEDQLDPDASPLSQARERQDARPLLDLDARPLLDLGQAPGRHEHQEARTLGVPSEDAAPAGSLDEESLGYRVAALEGLILILKRTAHRADDALAKGIDELRVGFETEAQTLRERDADLEGKIEEIQHRLIAHGYLVQVVKGELFATDRKVEEFEEEIARSARSLGSRIAALETRFTTQTETLGETFGNFKRARDADRSRLSEGEGRIAALDARVAEGEGRIAALEQAIELQGTTFAQELETRDNQIAALEVLRKRADELLERQIAELETATRVVSDAVTGIRGRAAEDAARIDALEGGPR